MVGALKYLREWVWVSKKRQFALPCSVQICVDDTLLICGVQSPNLFPLVATEVTYCDQCSLLPSAHKTW